MKFQKILAIAITTTFLVACGGGGGGSGDSAGPVTSTETFQLKTAFINDFTDTRAVNFTVSGTTSGVAVTGTGTITQSSVSAGTFEGAPALQKVSSSTGTLIVNGTSTPISTTHTSFTDSNYVPKGTSGSEYEVVTGTVTIPTTAKVNDSGLLFTSNRYTSSAKTAFLGTEELAFVLQPDTATTALLKITATEKNSFGTTTSVSTSSYRMTPAGALTPLSETGVEGTTNLTITFQ